MGLGSNRKKDGANIAHHEGPSCPEIINVMDLVETLQI